MSAAPSKCLATRSISIVVPCRNEEKYIESFMCSLLSQDLSGLDWEVIVADGMSGDGTQRILEEHQKRDPRIRVIPNYKKITAAGLNIAIREARGEVIIRMDVHTEYASDYVKQCVTILDQTQAANVGGPARTRPVGFTGRAIAAAYHSRFSTGGATFHQPNYEGYTDTVPYGCWRKSTLEQVGLFDESLVRNQDEELNWRLLRSGGKIWQSAQIVSWYHPRERLSQLARQYFQYAYWKVAIVKKHSRPISWRHLVPAAFVLGNLALIAGLLLSQYLGRLRMVTVLTAAEALLVAAYLVACLVASVVTAGRHEWRLLPALPIVFAVYHVSYGVGFLRGILHWPRKPLHVTATENAFTHLSR